MSSGYNMVRPCTEIIILVDQLLPQQYTTQCATLTTAHTVFYINVLEYNKKTDEIGVQEGGLGYMRGTRGGIEAQQRDTWGWD